MLASHFHHIHIFRSLIPFFDQWGYLILVITTFLEGLPFIGYISPGGISVIFAGFLSRIHLLHLWPALLFSMAGAYLGDILSYIIGRIYGEHLLKKYGKYFLLKEKYIERTEKFLHEHTGKAIVIGRSNYL